jgi:hypothetical protein
MSEVIAKSVEELREAYIQALKAGKPDDADIFKYALLERLEALSAHIGRNNRAKSPDERPQ